MMRGQPWRVTRRRFLALGATAGAATIATIRFGSRLAGAGDATRPAGGVRRLGEEYLRSRPKERSTAVLFRRVPDLRPTGPVIEQLPELASVVSADAAADRVVTVQGWVLARSEARAAGLVALGA